MAYNTWHGSQAEGHALMLAIANNCTCTFNTDGARTVTCVPHLAFAHDQHWLDYLVLMLRISKQLIQEEWLDEVVPACL